VDIDLAAGMSRGPVVADTNSEAGEHAPRIIPSFRFLRRKPL
jgi:hypothetical protein